MIYNFKKTNYKDFNVFSDNIMKPRAYFIPFSSIDELLKTDIRTERYNSSFVSVLSGDWNFRYFDKVSEIPDEFNTDIDEMDNIIVPSMWQFTGYEKPYYVNIRYQFVPDPPNFPHDCPVGIYSRKFNIDNTNCNYSVAFLGVAGSLDLFVNGKYVGYSEGSHNTAEFNLSDFITDGENEIAVVVHKWCNGTYLECQDMFRNNGIFRDVLLYKTGDNSIYDFEVKTTYNQDGSYLLDVLPEFKLKSQVTFTALIKDNNKVIAQKSINICPEKTDKITFDVLDVEEWSAEIPKLYDLYISLSKNEKTLEIIRKKIGFKHIEIKKNTFFFNNKKIKLLGVNHHDTNSKTGYVMTVEDMENDVRIFKEYNVNCVRTSHYPPDPIFLELCNEYGIYVVDEGDIEAHGVCEIHRPNLVSGNIEWKEHYWDRINRMFNRDKNHPSIIMWSLGNEAGGIKCQDYCYANLKKLTDIPIHYEGATRTFRFSYDVHSEMYSFTDKCAKIAKGKGLLPHYYKKPFYLCEYAHAMGVGAGDLEEYVKLFYSSDIMMGGCIWEFVDHAIYHKDGDYKYTYGGDHGEFKHDSNFCVDGLFDPERNPHSSAFQMKNCYRPIRAKLNGDNLFEFTNHNYFKTEKLTVIYSVRSNGIEKNSGSFDIEVEPQKTVTKKLDYQIFDHTVIVFNYYNNDFQIAREQIILNEKYKSLPIISEAVPKVTQSESKLIVTGNSFELIFNTENCIIESYIYNGKQLINQIPIGFEKGFVPEIFRAPLDNDMYLKKSWYKYSIDKLAIKCKKQSKYYSYDKNSVLFKAKFNLVSPGNKNIGSFDIDYKIYFNGEIKVSYSFINLKPKYLGRLGISIEMPKLFDKVKYYGYDMLSLSDFKEHAVFDLCELNVSDMKEEYIKPQESSMRYNTYFAEITDKNGIGFRFESENSFVFSANHFNSIQCSKANHIEDLKEYDTTAVNIDGFMMGAGSNSCGQIPGKNHRIKKVKMYNNSFIVRPIGDIDV